MAEQPPPHLNTPDRKERRRHPRFRPTARVEFAGGGEVVVLPIVDISAGGIRLQMNQDELTELEIDESVAIFLEANSDNGPVGVNVTATVVRIQRDQRSAVALEWQEWTHELAVRFDQVLRILQASATPV